MGGGERSYIIDDKGKDIKKFAIAGSALMILEYLQGAKVAFRLITGEVMLNDYNPDVFNITPLVRVAFAILLLWYIVKYCGLAQYQRTPAMIIENQKNGYEIGIEYIAQKVKLTDREVAIAKFLYEGATYRSIAEYLHLSVNTVKHHVTNIYRKAGVASKMELINMVRETVARSGVGSDVEYVTGGFKDKIDD